ncbi:cytochrome P450 4V2-like isoform X2 [Polyergus mexicanus]|uniref:cytochrome P450 4V2-like isoform X2 n=1 Tax=Polyergus mexicanus TaxID=615972 RepID=UPI0038B5BB07
MDLIFFTLCVFFVVLIIPTIISTIYHQYVLRRNLKHIPQYGRSPFSVTFELMKLTNHERTLWFIQRMLDFKDGIFIYWIGLKPIINLYKPEFFEIILLSTVNIEKGFPYEMLASWLGKGLLTSTETAMGVNVHAQEIETEYTTTIHRGSKLIVERFFRPWLWSDWLYNLVPSGRKYHSGLNIVHKFTKEVIRKRKIARQSRNSTAKSENEDGEFDIGKRQRKAFLDLLLDQNEKDETPLTDDELRAQVDTFMFEGHDTTAVAITWTLFLLGNNLEHQEKVHEELEEVFKDSKTPASVKELSQLKYLERIIKETLRLFPSVPLITRKLAEDVKINDYTLPKDATVTLAIGLMQKNPKVWSDPTKFDPDRFLPENSKHRNPYAYIPFSAGPRNCIGQRFALLEEKTILTAILRKWRVKSVKTADTVSTEAALILRPCEDIYIYFTSKK